MAAMEKEHLGVKLEPDEKRALEAMAAEQGRSASSLARIVLVALVQHYAQHGQRLVLPPRFAIWPGNAAWPTDTKPTPPRPRPPRGG